MTNSVSTRITQKRLQGELNMLKKEPLELIDTYPDEKDTFLWYFVVRGAIGTDYEGGFYIGKLMHNPEYPIKPPEYMMLTPSGRFEIGRKICLTNSSYHTDQWSPVWNMKTLLMGFLSIMSDDTTTGLSHIKQSESERKRLAIESVKYNMTHHKNVWMLFERFVNPDGTPRSDEEIKKLSEPIKKKKKDETNTESQQATAVEHINTEPQETPVDLQNVNQSVVEQIIVEAVEAVEAVEQTPVDLQNANQSVEQTDVQAKVEQSHVEQTQVKQINKESNIKKVVKKKSTIIVRGKKTQLFDIDTFDHTLYSSKFTSAVDSLYATIPSKLD